MKKQALIIGRFFNENRYVGSQRMTRLAEQLLRDDYDVKVITLDLNYYHSSVENECLEERIEPIRIRFRPWDYWLKRFYEKRELNFQRHLNKNVSRTDGSADETASFATSNKSFPIRILKYFIRKIWRWLDKGAKQHITRGFARQARRFIKQNTVVITSTGFHEYQPILAVRALKQRGVKFHWIADVRDLFHGQYYQEAANRFGLELERFMVDEADQLVTLSLGKKNMLQSALQLTKAQCDKITPIYTGYTNKAVENESVGILDKDRLTISYTGTIYPQMAGINMLLDILLELIEEGRVKRDKIHFVYAGKQGELFRTWLILRGLDDLMTDHGFVTRSEAWRIQNNADILLCLTWNTSTERGIMPLKLAEYIGCRKPIICLVSGNTDGSEEAEIVHSLRVGAALEEKRREEDKPALKAYFLDQYERKISGLPLLYEASESAIDGFSMEKLFHKYVELINGLEKTGH